MEHSDKLDKIGPALLAVQGAVSGVEKNSKNPAFKSRYADLAATNEATREHLTAAGVVCTQWPGAFSSEARTMDMTTMLLHAESGQWIKGTISIPLSKVDAQGYGSCCTYARRYALQAALGLSPEDDDGNEAVKPAPQAHAETVSVQVPKAKGREIYDRLSKANRALDSVEAFDAFWTKPSVIEAYTSLPSDWRQTMADEREDKGNALVSAMRASVDPKDQFDRMEAAE